MKLDLSADVVTLPQQLVDIESVSHHEQGIADAVTPWSPAPTWDAASGW